MPYIPKKDPYQKMRQLLRAYDVNTARLQVILDCSYPTAKKKIVDPGKLTTSEWGLISKMQHIPIQEVREVFLS